MPDQPHGDILILGGTGFIGRSLCEKLSRRPGGGAIVVPSRRPHRATAIRCLPSVRVVPADVHDDTALATLAAGCSAVVNLVAILHGSEADFRKAHVDLPRRLAAACARVDVRRIVHVSALGVGPDAPSHYLRTKTEGETLLLQAPGLRATALRPSVVFGEHDRFINLFARLQAAFPVMPLAGAAARFQPVWVEDVASAIAACLDDPATAGQAIECAGPQVFTLAELVRQAGRWSGHARPVLPLPDTLGRLQALLMECLPGEPLMSRDNLATMRRPNVTDGQAPGLARLGIDATAIGQVMPGVLSRRGGPARLDPWRGRAGRG